MYPDLRDADLQVEEDEQMEVNRFYFSRSYGARGKRVLLELNFFLGVQCYLLDYKMHNVRNDIQSILVTPTPVRTTKFVIMTT